MWIRLAVLSLPGIGILLLGLRYRRTRIQAQTAPWSDEEREKFQRSMEDLSQLQQVFANDRLRAQDDWRFALNKERLFLLGAFGLLIAAFLMAFLQS